MLQSYIGTFDSDGLRSLWTEEHCEHARRQRDGRVVEFWAVIDSEELHPIRRAMILGDRGTALELIGQQAISLGRIYE